MIKRIVKMTFQPHAVQIFLNDVFAPTKDQIRAFPGCRHMELLRHLNDTNVLFTLSIPAISGHLVRQFLQLRSQP